MWMRSGKHRNDSADKSSVDELIQEFLIESLEGLDRMERCLTELEAKPDDRELLSEIFRAVHTIKGTTGFLALPRLEKLAHAGEHLLGLLRDGKVQASRPVVDGMLALLDRLRSILRLIAATGQEGKRECDDDTDLIAMLDELRAGGGVALLREAAAIAATQVDRGDARTAQAVDHTLRVDVDTMNRMMNLVGELVLTRNQILRSSNEGEGFASLARRLDCVTADLRETVMRARTQPVGHLFQKFPRMVRDLAQSCGRCVRLDFEGQETRLDKSLLEALKDPITHALRNAVDHGIEAPSDRVRLGKALEGVIRLSARHEGGQVVIEVSDDGGGIDAQCVRRKAIDSGLITEERGRAMSDMQALQLVFEAGLSTKTEVTLVSGRGVGMDVVRANVESVGGVVELDSTPETGTTLRMRVPLTLAIVPALIVTSGSRSFAIPQNAVGELLLVPRRDEARMVQKIGDAPMLRLRDELLPMISLSDLLRLPRNVENGYYVVVLEAKGTRFGLMVDDLMDPQEIVVKPLARVLRTSGVFSGASMLGNGDVALILDLAGLAARARLDGNESRKAQSEATSIAHAQPAEHEVAMLVFEDAAGERAAIVLDAVERIEQVKLEDIEHCGGRTLLQHGSEFLPIDDASGLARAGVAGQVTVVICRRSGGERVGVTVRRVLDIAGAARIQDHARQGGRLALVQKRLAMIQPGFEALEEAA